MVATLKSQGASVMTTFVSIGTKAKHFADTYPGLRATTEFSLGTNQDAWHACNDLSVHCAGYTP
eukprot:5103264-Amphidinium_carterae.1